MPITKFQSFRLNRSRICLCGSVGREEARRSLSRDTWGSQRLWPGEKGSTACPRPAVPSPSFRLRPPAHCAAAQPLGSCRATMFAGTFSHFSSKTGSGVNSPGRWASGLWGPSGSIRCLSVLRRRLRVRGAVWHGPSCAEEWPGQMGPESRVYQGTHDPGPSMNGPWGVAGCLWRHRKFVIWRWEWRWGCQLCAFIFMLLFLWGL